VKNAKVSPPSAATVGVGTPSSGRPLRLSGRQPSSRSKPGDDKNPAKGTKKAKASGFGGLAMFFAIYTAVHIIGDSEKLDPGHFHLTVTPWCWAGIAVTVLLGLLALATA
jgi:hypothetical protein